MRHAILFALTATLSASAQTIALSHATVIDGTGAAPLRDATIVVSSGRITAMGPTDKVKAPAGAQVVVLAGKTIIPGIINAHSHISDEPALKLRHFAQFGVTSTIGMGGDGGDAAAGHDDGRVAKGRGAGTVDDSGMREGDGLGRCAQGSR